MDKLNKHLSNSLHIEDLYFLLWHIDLNIHDLALFNGHQAFQFGGGVQGGHHLQSCAGHEGIHTHSGGKSHCTTGIHTIQRNKSIYRANTANSFYSLSKISILFTLPSWLILQCMLYSFSQIAILDDLTHNMIINCWMFGCWII